VPRPNRLFPEIAHSKLDELRAAKRIDACRVQTKTVTVDRGGAEVVTWGTPGDPVPCKVELSNRAIAEGIRGGRAVPEADVVIRVHRDVVVIRDDRIHHVQSGQVFDVLNDPSTVTIGLELVISGKDSDG
jgi:hypothetical protein